MPSAAKLPWLRPALLLALAAGAALAAPHGDDDVVAHTQPLAPPALPDDAPLYRWPEEPLGWALRAHLALGLLAYVVILPIALVVEVAGRHHRWQPLVQLAGALAALLSIVFGWVGGSVHNAYARFGWFMLCLLAAQTALGLALAMGVLKRRAPYRAAGVLQLVCTYVAMVLGGIRFLNLCSHSHLGQCVSHFARGSALVAGSVVMLVGLRLSGPFIAFLRRPVEFYMSAVMVVVGLIGTFTEHNFFQSPDPAAHHPAAGDWSHKDLQHTMIGIAWLAAGVLGLLMTWRSTPRERSVVPAVAFIATGIAMIIHQQDLVMSSRAHFLFGASLVGFGLSTICEITLLGAGHAKDTDEPAPFQYLPVLFACASGMFLMGANRDMILFLINSGVDVPTYALILLSLCFAVMLYFYLLADLYIALAGRPAAKYHALECADPDSYSPARRHSVGSQATTLTQPPSPTTPPPGGFAV
ncbi:hypothetical protein H4R18_005259 [Coemansia javaensis]|uniref:Uncharacterized protein n=1 Tax=Coemansia javaensis TaxID=2761396 RepID=A0A9W8H2H5_9FUNG|nr:hypothetical protein H4R18_005259 [Coemansia javaensis]